MTKKMVVSVEMENGAIGSYLVDAPEGTPAHFLEDTIEKGSPRSGHWGHQGRPGERGGSLPKTDAAGITTTVYAERSDDQSFSERSKVYDTLMREIHRDWPVETARYKLAAMAVNGYDRGMELMVRRNAKGELVGIAALEQLRVDYDALMDYADLSNKLPFLHLGYIATKEKGHGTSMLLQIARMAVDRGWGIAGEAMHSAASFYTGIMQALNIKPIILGETDFAIDPDDLRNILKLFEGLT